MRRRFRFRASIQRKRRPVGSIIRPVSLSHCDPFIAMVKTAGFRHFDDRAMFEDLAFDRTFAYPAPDGVMFFDGSTC